MGIFCTRRLCARPFCTRNICTWSVSLFLYFHQHRHRSSRLRHLAALQLHYIALCHLRDQCLYEVKRFRRSAILSLRCQDMINWASNTSLIKSGINEFNLSTRCVLPVSAYNVNVRRRAFLHFYSAFRNYLQRWTSRAQLCCQFSKMSFLLIGSVRWLNGNIRAQRMKGRGSMHASSIRLICP